MPLRIQQEKATSPKNKSVLLVREEYEQTFWTILMQRSVLTLAKFEYLLDLFNLRSNFRWRNSKTPCCSENNSVKVNL